MKRFNLISLLLPLLMAACASQPPVAATTEVENPYRSRAIAQLQNGSEAVLLERWQAAELSFSRALQAAQLADDMPLIIQSWYQQAQAQQGAGDLRASELSLQNCMALATRHGDEVMQMRVRLARALQQMRQQQSDFDFAALPASLVTGDHWPVDIRLQAARLAQRTGETEAAQRAYRNVINHAGISRAGLKMQAEAEMGMALLARDRGDSAGVLAASQRALQLCHRIGAPHLAAHALLLQGQVSALSVVDRRDRLQRAQIIYSSMADLHGERDALHAWLALAGDDEDGTRTDALRLRLRALEAKLGELEGSDARGVSNNGK